MSQVSTFRGKIRAGPLAGLAFLNTSTAASTAVVVWAIIESVHRGKPTALGSATAAVAGLVAITPGCRNVSPMGAMSIGMGASTISYLVCGMLKPALGYDESLDVFGVHALGGAWGVLASGIFAMTLGHGVESNAVQIIVQLKGIIFVVIFVPIATVIIVGGLQMVFGSLHVDEDEAPDELALPQKERST